MSCRWTTSRFSHLLLPQSPILRSRTSARFLENAERFVTSWKRQPTQLHRDWCSKSFPSNNIKVKRPEFSDSQVRLKWHLWIATKKSLVMGVGTGVHGETTAFPGFWNLINFGIDFLVEKCFSLSFGVGKMKFHHCFSTPGKILPTPLFVYSGFLWTF